MTRIQKLALIICTVAYIVAFCILGYILFDVVEAHYSPLHSEVVGATECSTSDCQEVIEFELDTIEPVTEPATEFFTEAPTEPETEPPTEPITYSTDIPTTDVEMLACIIYREGGSDQVCDDCRRRIGNVVLNRVDSNLYEDTIYGVLTEYRAYGDIYWNGLKWPSYSRNATEEHAVIRAYEAAQWLLDGNRTDVDGPGWYGQAEFAQGVQHFKCCGIYFSRFRT